MKKWVPTSLFSCHTEVRWLSRGSRVLQLRVEIMLLERGRTAKENLLHEKMQDDCFVTKVVCLADFFFEVNSLKISLQGNLTMLHTARDKVAAFKCKIQLYQKRVEDGDNFFHSDDDSPGFYARC
ncbi:hypothetical protein OTU49_002065 [Cherax quadricarinatus]|uniref:Uncharacterized protein n=1 Tax=Cherax quadricarinatus TaxID=27406 RepID=A0AAW0XDQ9_CHEQU